MQILASALPGFRDLRAPLIAGYLWLVFVWIWIKPDIHKRPTNEVAAAVYDLAKDVGPIWIGLGVGVAAYLIGAVSQALSPIIGHKVWPIILHKMLSAVCPRLAENIAIPGSDLVRQYEEDAKRKASVTEVREHVSVACRGLDKELELPATLLLGKEPDPQLFSEADRLQAERELRLAVVPPLLFIAVFLGWNQSCWWWWALIAVAVLLWQGHSRNLRFRSLMIDALDRGFGRSRSIEKLKGWVEGLPEPSSEQKADGWWCTDEVDDWWYTDDADDWW